MTDMKEMKRGDGKKRFGWTDVLDPDGKPYLCQDDKGVFRVLYWKAFFRSDQWQGSDWFDVPGVTSKLVSPSKVYPVRVWQLPGVEYAKSKVYTHQTRRKVVVKSRR